jgi:TonB family protein
MFAPEGTQAWILSEDMEYQCRVLRQRLLKTSATGTPRVSPQESKPQTQDEKTGGGPSTPGNSGEQRPAIESPPAPLAAPTSVSAGDPAHNVGTARNSTATTTTSVKVAASPGVKAPALLYKVQPEYAEEARKAGLQGAVILSVDVGTDGYARNFKVVRGLGMGLDEKAIEAVQKWKFRPGSKDGKPVIVAATIQVNFRLPRDPASSNPSSSRDTAANPAMQKGSASYLQQRLHLWEVKDAKAELGRVVGRFKNAESETFTFADPTKSYRVFDLTFDTQTRKLVEIRVYPWGGLHWDECKALWGSNYSQSTTEEPGVLVYSYLTRPITALVRSSGEVVSFDFR